MSGTTKPFKRGTRSLGPQNNQANPRPGTANNKRPASPNTKNLVGKQGLGYIG